MQIKRILAHFVCAASIILTFNANATEISANQVGSNKIYSVSIIGEIKEGDFNQLINTIKTEGYLPFMVDVKSKGGSVTEAIKIAEFINESLLPVRARDYCYSSCFFIWISSIERSVFYKGMYDTDEASASLINSKVIGLHRPYFNKKYFSSLSMSEAQDKHKELENNIRQYLKDMNVHEKWIDTMMMYSSENIRLITPLELEQEFGFKSHSFEEWLLSKCPIDPKDLLLGQAELAMKIQGIDGENIRLSKQQRDNAFQQYTIYTSCKDDAIRESQQRTVKKLFK